MHMRPVITIKCRFCGGLKETIKPNLRFCSPACKKAYWKMKRRKERAALELLRQAVEKISEEDG